MSDQMKIKRGRPNGSKTKTLTPAMKASREYFDLLCAGTKPIDARIQVAEDWASQSETIRCNLCRHIGRMPEIYESEFRQHAAKLAGTEQVEAAMRAVREKLAELLDRLNDRVSAELTATESQDEIHAKLTEWVSGVLTELYVWAHEEAKRLSADQNNAIDPLIQHGGIVYLESFAKTIKQGRIVK